MELTSKVEACICHYKDNVLVAITHTNGRNEMLKVEEMNRGDHEEFFEANRMPPALPAGEV